MRYKIAKLMTSGLASCLCRWLIDCTLTLSPAIRSSRAEFPFEGLRLSGPVRRTEASMAGSHAVSAREPGQIREEAALSDTAHAPWASLAGAEDRRARPRSSVNDQQTPNQHKGTCRMRPPPMANPAPTNLNHTLHMQHGQPFPHAGTTLESMASTQGSNHRSRKSQRTPLANALPSIAGGNTRPIQSQEWNRMLGTRQQLNTS
jgi:hypothetical protein